MDRTDQYSISSFQSSQNGLVDYYQNSPNSSESQSSSPNKPLAPKKRKKTIWDEDEDEDEPPKKKSQPSTPITTPPPADPPLSDPFEDDFEDEDYDQSPVPFIDMACGCESQYARLNMIAQGGYGVVYRVRETATRREMSLKRIKFHKSQLEWGFPVTALRELESLLNLHHQNIVNVDKIVTRKGKGEVYMAMEFVEHDLRRLMNQRNLRFTLIQVKCLMLQLLDAMEYMHSKYLIHRDLKTSNILITARGQLKVCDFGMARVVGDPARGCTPLHECTTVTYRAPESYMNINDYSSAVDMWGVGCIFSELLENKPLFALPKESKGSTMALLSKHVELLGTPTEAEWPVVSGCSPLLQLKGRTSKMSQRFRSARFDAGSGVVLTEKGLDLLESFLKWNPEQRITAAEAKKHPWFSEDPVPSSMACLQRSLSSYESLHRMDREKVRAMFKKVRANDAETIQAGLDQLDSAKIPAGAGKLRP